MLDKIKVRDPHNFLPELELFNDIALVDNEQQIDIMPCMFNFELPPSNTLTMFISREPDNHRGHIDYQPLIDSRPNSIFAVTCYSRLMPWQLDRTIFFASNLLNTVRANPEVYSINVGPKQFLASALLGGWSDVREVMLNELSQHHILEQCLVNLKNRQTDSTGKLRCSYQSTELSALDLPEFNELAYEGDKIHTMIELGNWIWLSQRIPYNVYNSCYLAVVAETENNAATDTFMLSEKIAKPLLVGQPFLVYGCQHFLKYFQELGFQTYAPWLDESYDNINDRHQRAAAIIKSLHKFSMLDNSSKLVFAKEMQKVAEFNRRLIQNKKFLLKPVVDAIRSNFK